MPRGAGLIRRVPITLSAAVGDNGWTTFTASGDTQITYVSQSLGNDGTGVIGDINHPFKTVSAGLSQLRTGKPDWLLFKKDDTWTNEPLPVGSLHGRSSTEPMVIGSYHPSQPGVVDPAMSGHARPLFLMDQTFHSMSNGCDNLAIVGLEAYAYKRDPNNVNFSTTSRDTAMGSFSGDGVLYNWLLFENCKFHWFSNGGFNTTITPGNPQAGTLRLRRNVFAFNYASATGHSQGMFLAGCSAPFLEQNHWHNGGWSSQVSGNGDATIFNRNVYLSEVGGPATVNEDITTFSSSEGIQMRRGGTNTNSLCIRNSEGINVGHRPGDDDASGPPCHFALVSNCVILEPTAIGNNTDPADPRSCGIGIIGIADTSITVQNCIVAQNAGAAPHFVATGIYTESQVAAWNCTNNIVYDYPTEGSLPIGTDSTSPGAACPIYDRPGTGTFSGNNIDGAALNTFNSTFRPNEPFPNPSRTAASYAGTIGLTASTDALMTAMLANSKDNWDTRLMANAVNNYIRAGFGR